MKQIKRFTAAGAGLFMPVLAFAQTAPTNALEMAQAIDLSDTTSAVLVAGGAVLGVVVVGAGVRYVLRLLDNHR